jgi:hypothetical protein
MGVETEGNEVSTGFLDSDKTVAVRCWLEAIAATGLDDKVLADEARVSRGYFSKISNGGQGDLLGLVYRVGRKRPELRLDFLCRLAEAEGADPVAIAAQHLAAAALRFLTLRARLPERIGRGVKTELLNRDEAASA